MILVERNNHGIATITRLRDTEKYPQILLFQSHHVRIKSDDPYRDPEKRFGWLTTAKTRPIIVNALAVCIMKMEFPAFTKEDIDELYTFVRDKKGKYEADTNCCDDRVMVLAFAAYILPMFPPVTITHENDSNCIFCRYYDKYNNKCMLTQRTINNPENKWCNKFIEDNSWLETPYNLKKNKVGYISLSSGKSDRR
jgi:hypothetical protein